MIIMIIIRIRSKVLRSRTVSIATYISPLPPDTFHMRTSNKL